MSPEDNPEPQLPNASVAIPYTDQETVSIPDTTETLSRTQDYGSRLNPTKTVAILSLYDANPTIGITQLSAAVQSDARTVRAVLDRHRNRQADAKALLADYAIQAAVDWQTASGKAAKSGNHQPARDLLLHTGVIEPTSTRVSVGVGVTVVLGSPATPAHYEPAQAIEAQVLSSQADSDTEA